MRNQLPEYLLKRLEELEREGKVDSEEYQWLSIAQWYQRHFCLLPQWPASLMQCLKKAEYPVMQEMVGLSPFFFYGNMVNWQRSKEDLKTIITLTLLIDFPKDVVLREGYEQWQKSLPNTSYFFCSMRGHLSWWDTPKEVFPAVAHFILST